MRRGPPIEASASAPRQSHRYLAHWNRLFNTADTARILAELEREDEWGDALRQADPFTGILPPETRDRIFDAYESK